jgi:hypothetical protein
MVKTARQTTDDETEGLVSGESADVKSQTQIQLWAAAHKNRSKFWENWELIYSQFLIYMQLI